MKESLRLGNHEESTDTDTLLLFGGIALAVLGAGMILSNRNVRQRQGRRLARRRGARPRALSQAAGDVALWYFASSWASAGSPSVRSPLACCRDSDTTRHLRSGGIRARYNSTPTRPVRRR